MGLKTNVTNIKIYTKLEFRTQMRPQMLKCLPYRHGDQIKVLNTQVTRKAQFHSLLSAELGSGNQMNVRLVTSANLVCLVCPRSVRDLISKNVVSSSGGTTIKVDLWAPSTHI